MATTIGQRRAVNSGLCEAVGETGGRDDAGATVDLTALLDAATTIEMRPVVLVNSVAGTSDNRSPGDGPIVQDLRSVSRRTAGAQRRRAARASRWARTYARGLFACDCLTVLTSVAVGYLARSGWQVHGDAMVGYTLLLVVPWLLSLLAIRGYSDRVIGYGSDEYRRVTTATVRAAAAVVVVGYLLRVDVPRGVIIPVFLCGLLGLPLERWAVRKVVHWRRKAGACCRNMLVVGDLRHVTELVAQLRREPHAGYRVAGVCLPHGVYGRNAPLRDVPLVGSLSSIVEAAVSAGADTVAVTAAAELTSSRLRRLGWALEGTGIELVVAPALTDVAGPRIHTHPVAGLPLIHVEEPDYTGGRALVKLVLDKLVAGAALVVLAPVLIAIAIAVRYDSSGPVIFRQTRTGLHGRPFSVFKFRSMVVGAERLRADLAWANESDGPLFKMRDDPRVTRVGRVLRRWSLDELPQLLNVLRGDMSLVGPRPPLPDEVARYDGDVRRRLLVRPGLTGLWQVSGRSDLSWRDGLRLDLYYVENWSISTDMMILWKTFGAVLRRRGAY